MPALLTETSVSAITEGVLAADNSKGGVLTKVFIVGAILLVTAAGAKKWFYPYTMGDLERQMNYVEGIIERNTTLERDLLGNSGWKFRERLDGEHQKMCKIQERATTEPNRWNLLAWFRLHWREMREVKKCYCSVLDLKKDVLVWV
ncbi:hypothetical protein PQX77_001391 [Marasmius sp. AFHP31]|nr:hypothetical protein PQX77_001391 [Marasmius sp. AFHP31]